MKKMMLIGMVVVMMLGLVGCNKEEKDIVEKIQNEETVEGFVPNEVVEEETANLIEEVIDTANLEKYYDVTKYVGTPRLVKDVWVTQSTDKTVTTLSGDKVLVSIPYDDRLVDFEEYDCIVVDNNTEGFADDIVVYIFTE